MEIVHDLSRKSFMAKVDGCEAYLNYLSDGESFDVRHTVVPSEIEGRGIASALVREAYDYARAKGLQAIATCSYAVKWLERHPEYNGIVSSDYAGNGSCAL